eukprot:2139866-Rhodomonas_salina.3
MATVPRYQLLRALRRITMRAQNSPSMIQYGARGSWYLGTGISSSSACWKQHTLAQYRSWLSEA